MPYVLVLYYSVHGSTELLADCVARGVERVDGMEARVRTVPPVRAAGEVVSEREQTTPYASIDDLKNCSALALGSPVRFGNMAAPLKYFIDSTSDLWLQGGLSGRPAGVFTSSSSMHGGQEATLLTMMLPLLHHGMLITGLPYTEPSLITTQTGGTPYGPSHVAGLGNQKSLSDEEKSLAMSLGSRLAKYSLKLV